MAIPRLCKRIILLTFNFKERVFSLFFVQCGNAYHKKKWRNILHSQLLTTNFLLLDDSCAAEDVIHILEVVL